MELACIIITAATFLISILLLQKNLFKVILKNPFFRGVATLSNPNIFVL
jgi:hypothetical protein